MGFHWAFLFLPAADFFVGVDTFNSRDDVYKVLRERYGGGGGGAYCAVEFGGFTARRGRVESEREKGGEG